MFEKVLSKETKESLAILGKSGLLNDAYLAGGTALALQIGHRVSIDLDFFTPKEFDEKILVQQIQKQLPNFRVEAVSWGTILGYIKRTRFSLFFYKYPLLFPTHQFLSVEIADIKDIAAMKVASIADRGTKRDFIDLYFIIAVKKILTLEEVLKLYDKKFRVLKQNKVHILKSLIYFEDAEKEETPKMLEEVDWNKVKNFFKKEVINLSKKLL
jgi:hypothetical protein